MVSLMGAHIHQDNFSWSKMLNRAKTTPRFRDNSVEPIETGNRGNHASTRQAAKRKEAKRRRSHIDLVGLRETTLQHFRRNARNRQLRCNKGHCLSASNKGNLEHRFSNSISSIFDAEDR